MEESGTIKLVLQISGVFIPAFVGLATYIYNRQIKAIFHQINESNKDSKVLESKVNRLEVALGIQGEKINNIEDVCKIKHKE